MANEKVLGMIGIAKKAGEISCGAFLAESSIKKGKSKLVIISTDASPNTNKKFINMCKHHGIEYIEFEKMDVLGNCCGKENSSVISINSNNFKNAIFFNI